MHLGDLSRPVPVGGDAAARDAEFEAFYGRHVAELSRLAFLVTGDSAVADEVTADALLATWRQWERVTGADSPIAYVRRVVVNIGTSRVRRRMTERRLLPQLFPAGEQHARVGDVEGVLDVRAALLSLPARRRACLVLRYAFDLSEDEVARTLGVTVGTVKSQTSKAAAQLRALLGPAADPRRRLRSADPGEPDGTPAPTGNLRSAPGDRSV